MSLESINPNRALFDRFGTILYCLLQQAIKNSSEPVKQCPVRVYGLQGHSSYLAIDLPDEMLQEGEVFGYQEKFYQVCSVLKDSEDHFCLNVNSIVETL